MSPFSAGQIHRTYPSGWVPVTFLFFSNPCVGKTANDGGGHESQGVHTSAHHNVMPLAGTKARQNKTKAFFISSEAWGGTARDDCRF